MFMNNFGAWETELYHHGIKGMKWGVRRYQNKDGTLTEFGKKRYLNKNGTYNYSSFQIDINRKNPLTTKSRVARSILKSEIEKDRDLNNAVSGLRNRKDYKKLRKAEKIVDGFLQKKLNVKYTRKSQFNGTTQMARKIVDDILRDNRKKVDSSEELNRLGLKDHLGAMAVGALAGPYAAGAYTASRLSRDKKR